MNPDYLESILGPDGCLTTALAEGEEIVLRVAGECMKPDVGHQAEVRLKKPGFFVPGDLLAFRCSYQKRLLLHRFLGYVWRRGEWKLMTMADHGNRPDPLLNASHVLGKVIATDGRASRITTTRRLESVRRYVVWCSRRIIRGC
jgi:hypothetical protein